MKRLALDDLDGIELDLLGLGIDICALIPHLEKAAAVRAWVDDPATVTDDERSLCATHGVGIGPVGDWPGAAAVVIRAPGFPRYRPDIARRIEHRIVSTPVDLWLNSHAGVHTALVTGTKGKSTVATMIAALLPGSHLCGNIGVPIWSIADPPPGTTMVIEVSSYQAADTNAVVDLAVLTSLDEDHVSWHGSLEQYHADKLGPVLAARRVLTINRLISSITDRRPSGAVRSIDPVADDDGFGHLPAHLAGNARLARAAAEWLVAELAVEAVEDPVETILALPPLPGRLRPLITDDGRRWYDDALASNPSGAAAAVAAFAGHPIWLIVGGIDRRVSLDPLVAAATAAAREGSFNVVALPDSGPDIVDELLTAGVTIAETAAVDDVGAAVTLIAGRAVRSSVVLFSPAAPTPPRHGNWADRSAAFVAAVHELCSPRRGTTEPPDGLDPA